MITLQETVTPTNEVRMEEFAGTILQTGHTQSTHSARDEGSHLHHLHTSTLDDEDWHGHYKPLISFSSGNHPSVSCIDAIKRYAGQKII